MNHLQRKTPAPVKKSLALLTGATLLLVVIFCFLKPIPQYQNYHQFADQRSWLGVPNAWNVLSNIAIALPGLWGLFLLSSTDKVSFIDSRERWVWMGVMTGLVLTAVGSAYYHLAPDNSRLLWDRLPMAFVFMTLATALISERVKGYPSMWLWPAMVSIGFCSVWVWYVSELQGNSDLRFYIGIQVFTILTLTILLFSPSPYDKNKDLAFIIACYAIALLCDLFDHQINRLTGGVISGHSLKHLAVGLAGAWLVWIIRMRKPGKFV